MVKFVTFSIHLTTLTLMLGTSFYSHAQTLSPEPVLVPGISTLMLEPKAPSAAGVATPFAQGNLGDFVKNPPSNGMNLNIAGPSGELAHFRPTTNNANYLVRSAGPSGMVSGSGTLTYHGGPIMQPNVQIYTIFWNPGKLQTGAASTYSTNYINIQKAAVSGFAGHGLGTIHTQYYQSSSPYWVQNVGGWAGTYTDTANYPTSGCTDSATPGACLTDTQIRAEITKVMNANGWTGGLNKIYLLFTSPGEGSCFSNNNAVCAYKQYCAYHSYYTLNNQTVVYGNEPYGNPNMCAGTQITNNGDLAADTAASTATHEISEAITDPMLNAWYDSVGYENGDKCAYDFGTPTWNNGKANQYWNGYYWLFQREYDNHTNSCLNAGPP